jgi:hypothetical protein
MQKNLVDWLKAYLTWFKEQTPMSSFQSNKFLQMDGKMAHINESVQIFT